MPIQPPSREELAQVASAFALHLTKEEIDAFYQLAEPTAAGYARLDELEDETMPGQVPPRGDGLPAHRRGESVQRMELAMLDPRSAGGAAGRAPGGHQGQRLRRPPPGDARER